MSKRFKQTDDWETERLTCPRCNWQGTFFEGENDVFQDLTTCHCPKCGKPVANVSHIVDKEKYFKNLIEEGDK